MKSETTFGTQHVSSCETAGAGAQMVRWLSGQVRKEKLVAGIFGRRGKLCCWVRNTLDDEREERHSTMVVLYSI
jgi:hypothetical protein